MRPNWSFWMHNAPNMRPVEVQSAHWETSHLSGLTMLGPKAILKLIWRHKPPLIKYSEKIRQQSFLENRDLSGLTGALSGPIGVFLGLIGTKLNSSTSHSCGETAAIAPKGPFLSRLGPFGPSPRLTSPRLDFPKLHSPTSMRILLCNGQDLIT